MTIQDVIQERMKQSGLSLDKDKIPDIALLDTLVMAAVTNILDESEDIGLDRLVMLLCGIAGASYKLGLTAKCDTALEAGTKLLEDLDEK